LAKNKNNNKKHRSLKSIVEEELSKNKDEKDLVNSYV
jgi:hypothetical protein